MSKRTLSKNFTDDQLETILKLRRGGASWVKIAHKLNQQWYLDNSPKVYQGVYRRFAKVLIDRVKKSQEPHPHEDFTREALGHIRKNGKVKQKRYFISAVGAAADLYGEGFASVQSYCEKEKAELILLPMRAHVKALEDQPLHYDPKLKPFKHLFSTEFVFNENIKALELGLNPQQVQPLTGTHRIRGRNDSSVSEECQHLVKNNKKYSLLVSHSKQMMEIIATGNNSAPRMLHTTGALTLPKHQKNRVGIIATEDHVLGGLILEINEDEFYVTQVQFNLEDGSFVDKYAKRFYPNGDVVQERAEAFVMGDIHPGMESQDALAAWYEVWDYIKPKRIFLHDWFDGHSISHHLKNQRITKALRPKHFKTLEAEINYAQKLLYEVAGEASKDAEIYPVSSNHPGHVIQYLEEGRYMNDCDENYALAHRMVVETLDGENPLQKRLDPDGRFNWLHDNDDLLVEGVQCGAHGHLGVGGSKGSLKQSERIYSSSMTAHAHTPGIYHGAYQVGHTSDERHGYNKGPSTWLTCSGVVYKGGHKQLIIALKRNWKI